MIFQKDQITITVVGDDNVGKTFMLMRFARGRIPNERVRPIMFENYYGTIHVDGNDYNIHLWDTSEYYAYDKLRPLSYPSTDCFLMCFALNSTTSYMNVQNKYIPEIKHYKKSAPIILVGTKSDLKSDPTEHTLSTADCLKLKDEIRSYKYIECSAYTADGIQSVFSEAVRAVIDRQERKKKRFKCDIL